MFLVGLTGGISTGKSLVSNILRSKGVEVIDADIVAREVVQPGKRAWKRIRQEFGESVFNLDGTLDRQALGKIIFAQSEKRKILNSITHPEIYKSILYKCIRLFLSGHQLTVVDLPLLYESGKMVRFMHKIVVVSCNRSQQLDRLSKRDQITENDALLKISAQMSLEEKCKAADYVIDNSRDEAYAKAQVEAVLAELQQSRTHWKIRFMFFVTVGTCCSLIVALCLGLGKLKEIFL